MLRYPVLALIAALFVMSPAAHAQMSAGGGATTTVGTPVGAAAAPSYAQGAMQGSTVPPVFQPDMPQDGSQMNQQMQVQQPTAPVVNAPDGVTQAPANADAQAQMPADPCAAYMDSYDVYAVCQDRMKKLQRMQDAKARRVQSANDEAAAAAARAAARNIPPVAKSNIIPDRQIGQPATTGAITPAAGGANTVPQTFVVKH